MLVAGVGDPPEVRDHGVVAVAEVAAGEDRGAVHRHRLDHDHRGPADGALQVVAEVALGGQALRAHVGGMGAEVQAVLEGLRADPDRAEEVGERGFGRHMTSDCARHASHRFTAPKSNSGPATPEVDPPTS